MPICKQGLHTLTLLTAQADGRPFPPGQSGYSGQQGAIGDLIGALSVDPGNGFVFEASEKWRDPFRLLRIAVQYEAVCLATAYEALVVFFCDDLIHKRSLRAIFLWRYEFA